MVDKLEIGPRIRQIRKKCKKTLQQVADECDFSKSLLSKIENGKALPAIATLVKIAGALETNVSNILGEQQGSDASFTAEPETSTGMMAVDAGYRIFPFGQDYPHKKMQPFLVIAHRDEVKEHHVDHAGEEFIYVLKGEMIFQVGDREYKLTTGDSLYFQAVKKHQVIPVSKEVVYLDIFSS